MTKISIPVSEDESQQIQDDAISSGFDSVTEYVLHLIREARMKDQDQRLSALLPQEDASSEWWSALQLSTPHFD